MMEQKPVDFNKIFDLGLSAKQSGYKCHWCQFRHSECNHREPIAFCRDFKIGGCYSCKYYFSQNGKELNEKETDQWFKRGCEVYCPSSLRCKKRKRLSRKRKKRLKKKGYI